MRLLLPPSFLLLDPSRRRSLVEFGNGVTNSVHELLRNGVEIPATGIGEIDSMETVVDEWGAEQEEGTGKAQIAVHGEHHMLDATSGWNSNGTNSSTSDRSVCGGRGDSSRRFGIR